MLKRLMELDYLTQCYEQHGNQLIVMYGQKNVGKTTLLKMFCEKKPYHYYMARPCSERQQRYFWGNQVRRSGIALDPFPDFSMILEAISGEKNAKTVIVIDEFHAFIKVNETFITELVAFLKQSKQEVLLILCSSQVGFVENSLVTKIGASAQEISGFCKVKEIDFKSITTYFPKFSTKEAVITYAMLGGMPGLWKHFNDSISVKENICRAIEQKETWLMTEAVTNIEDQLRETNVYYTLLSAMAEGKYKLNELYAYTGYSRAKISVYLKSLMELEIVEKVFSFDSEGWDHTQKGVYRIKNHFVFFYFRFFYPHLSEYDSYSAERYYEEFIESELDHYVAELFPKICRESMELMNQKNALAFPISNIGEWVGKVGTIPLLAKGDGESYVAGLCHWTKPALSFADYEWFLFCIEKAKFSVDTIYLFSACGFDKEVMRISKDNNKLVLIDMC